MRRKGPITVEDVLASPLIASPLRLLDCSSWYTGGGVGSAVVITSAERARDTDRPVYISGFGQCTTHEWVTDRLGLFGIEPSVEPNLVTTGAKVAAADAYALAGMTPDDVDLVETSAPFTFLNMIMLEDLGFCEKGEGKDFVAGGGVAFDGGLPFNTNGGYLSFGQAANGMHMALEAVQQLRVEARGSSGAGRSQRPRPLPRGTECGSLCDPAELGGRPLTIDWAEGLPFMIGPYELGLTETSPETAGFWEGVASGQLRIKRCANCGRHLHPRRIFCPQCSAPDLEWLTASGEGTVYTFSTVYRSPSPEFEAPYTNGIVQLAEGVHLFGRLIGKEARPHRDRRHGHRRVRPRPPGRRPSAVVPRAMKIRSVTATPFGLPFAHVIKLSTGARRLRSLVMRARRAA